MPSGATDRTDVADLQRRHQQQAAIATLSQLAIGARDVRALLPHATALIASTLNAEVVAIGEFAANLRRFTIRSGVGTVEPAAENIEVGRTAIAALHPQSPLVIAEPGHPGHRALLRDITRVDVEAYVAAIVDGDAEPWGFVLAATARARAFTADETEFVQAVAHVLRLLADHRKREGLALAELEGRFAKVFQTCPVALGMSTIDSGRIIDVNARWLTLFGFERNDVIGRTNAELRMAVEPERRAGLAAQARAVGVVPDTEMKVRNKSGEVLEIIVSAVRFEMLPGEDVWISAMVDITDRKRSQAEHDQLLAREQIARAEAEQALEKLDAVYTITDRMEADHGLGELLGEVLRRLRRTLQVDHASVLLLEEEGKALYLRAIEGGLPTPEFPRVRVPLGVGFSGRIAAEDRAMIVNDYGTVDLTGIQGTTAQFVRDTTKSVMGAPFHVGGKVAGVVVVTCVQARQFTAEELKLLTLAADRVAPAIERGRLIAKILSGLERQRTLSRRLLTAQEEERRRLAVELHDELGQVLTAVKINLESLQRASAVTATTMAMDGMIHSVDEALQRVRDIALDLRPSVLDDLGLPAAMRWYVDRFARAGRIEAHLSIGVLPPLEPGLKTACFRVAQEALTNVDRHAHADHVWIDLHVLDGALELSVRDDGIGFDVAAARERAIHGASVGLLGMQERVALTGGEYDIVNVAAGGTEVRARFPLATGAPS